MEREKDLQEKTGWPYHTAVRTFRWRIAVASCLGPFAAAGTAQSTNTAPTRDRQDQHTIAVAAPRRSGETTLG